MRGKLLLLLDRNKVVIAAPSTRALAFPLEAEQTRRRVRLHQPLRVQSRFIERLFQKNSSKEIAMYFYFNPDLHRIRHCK